MEALDPLAVMHVTCGPALDGLDVLRVDHEHRAATCLEQRKEGDPRDPSGFHGDRGDRTRDQPGRQGFESGRVGGKAAYWVGIVTGGDGYIMGCGPDVDARGVEGGGGQLRREGRLGAGLCLLA
jgi:hypothetical protein